MIVKFHSPTTPSRRSAFTLLEVLVVVTIILILASIATVSVFQVLKENKADAAKINAAGLDKALKTYMLRNDGNRPNSIEDILKYVDGGDPAKLIDPWGNQYQIGEQADSSGGTHYYIYATNPDTGEQIRSDTRR